MKKLLLIPVIGIFGALSLGAAASLGGIDAGDLAASDAVVLACDDDGVFVDYAVEFSDAYGGFVVDEVEVTGIDPDCNGSTIMIVLTNNGDNIGEGGEPVSVVSEITQQSVSIEIPRAPVELVNDIHIAIFDDADED